MDYEKKYKAALELARDYYKANLWLYKADENLILEDIFPELAESEEGKIKEDLIQWVNEFPDTIWRCHHKKDVIDWLEKQGEKKPKDKYTFKAIPRLLEMIEPTDKAKAYCQKLIDSLENEGYSVDAKIVVEKLKMMNGEDVAMATMDEQKPFDYENATIVQKEFAPKTTPKIEPKFKVGDWCIDNEDATIFQIVKVLDNTYTYKTNEGSVYSCTHYSLENDARLWTIKDAKDRDILTVNGRPFIYCCNGDYQGNYCCIDSDGVFRTSLDFGFNGKTILPATKEQRDLILQMSKNTPLNY